MCVTHSPIERFNQSIIIINSIFIKIKIVIIIIISFGQSSTILLSQPLGAQLHQSVRLLVLLVVRVCVSGQSAGGKVHLLGGATILQGAKVLVLSSAQLDTVGAHFASVVLLTVGLAFKLEVVAVLQCTATVPTHKTVGVVFGVERSDTDLVHDWLVAATTVGRKELNVARTTVAFALVLVVALRVVGHNLVTVLTGEVFRMPGLAQGGEAFVNDRSLTGGTLGREEGVIVGLTVGQAVLFAERVQVERLVALHTGEALRMPGLSERGNDFIRNRLLAGEAFGQEQLVEVILAVGLAIVGLEIVRVEHSVTAWVGADETLRVPLFAQRKDGLLLDGQIAGTAFGRKELVIVVETVGVAVLLHECVRRQWDVTLVTVEAFRMPVFAHGV